MSQSQQLTIDQAVSLAKKEAKRGNAAVAFQLYNAILQQQPGHSIAKKSLNKLQKDFPDTQPILAHTPSQDQINVLVNMYQSGQLSKAEQACTELLKTCPQSLMILNILGAALQGQNKLHEAVKSYDKAIQINPDYAKTYNNKGVALYELEKLEEALKSFDMAIQIKPDYAEAYSNRGNMLKDLGRLEEAMLSYNKAIQLNPDNADVYYNRGFALQDLERVEEAIVSYQKAISIDPQNSMFWRGFAGLLPAVTVTTYREDFIHFLIQMLNQPTVHPRNISKTVIGALRHHPLVLHSLELFKSDEIENDIDKLTQQLSTVTLLLRVMELSPIADLDIEKMLTKLRAAMLKRVAGGVNETKGIPFYAALAMHCFINEYVFSVSKEEKQGIELLQEKVKSRLDKGGNVPPAWVMVIGAYSQLYSFSWAENLLEFEWPDEVKKVVIAQVNNVREEQALRSKITRLSSIEDKVSQLVRDQYEENPYPRWVNTGLSDKPKSIRQVLKSLKFHLNFDAQEFPDKPDILIAGCGTGQHAIGTASRFLNCNVLAVDLSLSSLSYAKRKTQEFGIFNIEYMQGDILKLNQLERQFDIIESTGVLHHMNDPLAGWKILVERLRKGGLMRIGLYSEVARQGVVEARRQIEKKKYSSSSEDIHQFREEIIKMNLDTTSAIAKLRTFDDFYTLSECRDLLFHVQEHRFTLPQIEKALNELGLNFLGFEFSKKRIMNRFKEIYPEKDAQVSLSLWHQFELEHKDTFIEMYQFWVQKPQ